MKYILIVDDDLDTIVFLKILWWGRPFSTAQAAASLALYGTFEAMGITVTLAGTDDPDQDATLFCKVNTDRRISLILHSHENSPDSFQNSDGVSLILIILQNIVRVLLVFSNERRI